MLGHGVKGLDGRLVVERTGSCGWGKGGHTHARETLGGCKYFRVVSGDLLPRFPLTLLPHR